MFVFHWGTDSSDLGRLGMLSCSVCQSVQPAVGKIVYKYAGVMWLFSFVTQREYYKICNRCQNGWLLEKNSIQNSVEKDNIPFMRKYGILFFLAFVVFVMASEFLSKR